MFDFRFKENSLSYLIVYLMLLFKSGFFFCEYYSVVTATLLLILLIAVVKRKKLPTNKKHVQVLVLLLLLMMTTWVFRGFPELPVMGLDIVNMITALLFVSYLPLERFKRLYSNVLLAICITDLLGYCSVLVGVPFYNLFPALSNSNGRLAHFAILSFSWPTELDMYRLQGIFWEPGAFQALIIVAALFDLYSKVPVKNIKLRFAIYLAAIVFSYSTTGYVCALLLAFLIVYRIKRYRVIAVPLLVVSLMGGIAYLSVNAEGFLRYSTFGKLEEVEDAWKYGEDNTAFTRVGSVIYPMEKFVESPLWGMGEQGKAEIKKEHGSYDCTCTIVNYFANYGIVYGFVCLLGFIRFIDFRHKPPIEASIILLIGILATISEAFEYNPLFIAFMLYGFYHREIFLPSSSSINKTNYATIKCNSSSI